MRNKHANREWTLIDANLSGVLSAPAFREQDVKERQLRTLIGAKPSLLNY